MEQPGNSLAYWHVLFPLAGAVLFPLIRRWQPDFARTVVITNAAGSLLLASLLVGAYFSSDRQAPTAHEIPAAVGSSQDAHTDSTRAQQVGVMVTPGVDGVSLWFLVFIPLVALCVLLAEPAERWQPMPIGGLLVAESAALAVFTVRDVAMLSAAFAALGLANSVVVGSRGAAGIRAAARTLLRQQFGAAILIMISLTGTVVACSHMLGAPHAAPQTSAYNLDELVHEVRRLTSVSPPAELVWRQLSPWLFLSLVAGCLLWSGAFPFHVAPATALRESGLAGQALLGGITLKVGAWGLLRIALPLYPELMNRLGPFLLLWVMLSALYCAVSMYGGQTDAPQAATDGRRIPVAGGHPFRAEGAVVIVLLSSSGVLSQTGAGIIGASLLLVAHMICWMLYVLCSRDKVDSGAGGFQEPGGRGQLLFARLALAGIPGLALFPGLLLMFLGISASSATFSSGLPILVLYWLVIAVSGWAHLEPAREPVAARQKLTPTVRMAAVMLVGAIVVMGIAPGIFTRPIYEGVMEVLQQPM